MAHLSLSMLGPFQATLDGQPATGFESNKVRALLVYLAVEADRPHPRESLAGLLWPDYPDRSALRNLRYALSNLREAIGDREAEPPFLLISRETIQFNTASDHALDLTGFENLSGLSVDRLEQVVALRRGSFLEGFSCDSAPFEEWALVKREQLDQQMLAALYRLAEHYEQCGEYDQAIVYAKRQMELEPWDEKAYQQLMRALAWSGQRSAALAQYETCRRLLRQELGAEPSHETTALYESIRDETLVAPPQRPRPLAAPGAPSLRTIKGYELLERIGRGAFGVIYRARQRHVDRQVAIKVILPEHANQPDFIRRFEAEAQLVAQLEHLHIVPLYDYWREPDGAYLVMRLLKGGSLAKLLERGPVELSETARILDQIGPALAAAHRQGVIHRYLKPANILLDEEGNAYLSDFGIARAPVQPAQITADEAIADTAAYLSPEQLQSRALTPQADIYSLGVVLFEMLTGQHPFTGSPTADLIAMHLTTLLPSVREVRPDLPAELDRVIQCATAKDPAGRYADVMALVADVRRALAPEAAALPVAPALELPLAVTNPYKGLRAFQEADALDFFGREALTEHLLARMYPLPSPLSEGEGDGRWGRFLAVVGPSGSGKSSVVKAGLLPAIRRGALPGSDEWFVVEMLPGPHPFEELEIALLRIATRQHSGLMEQLQRDERGLIRAARLVLPSDDSHLLLIVDQFEELFTLVQDKAEATRFMDSLYAAVSDPRSPVRVLITLRADFYDRPLMHPDFSALMSQRTEVVTPLTTDELARAVAGPAERVGAQLEPGLVTDIVADVQDQPGALPLLQYALTELFEWREGRLLTRQAYESIGGVMGALGRRAEEVYAGLDAAGQAAAQQLFLRLVTLGEGIEDTRRRVLRSELESLVPTISDQPSAISHIIGVFGQSRLLSFDRDLLTRGPTIEVAHEALLREWKRLREWLDTSRADVRMQRLLAGEAAEWARANHEPSFLLQGARLAQFEGWAASARLALTQDERGFLEASLAERQKRKDEEAARQRREARAQQERRRQRRVIGAGAILLLVMAIAAVLIFQQKNIADAQRSTAQTAEAQAVQARATSEALRQVGFARELAYNALVNLDIDPERSVLIALQSLRQAYTAEGEDALRQALLRPLPAKVLRGHTDRVNNLAFSPDGKQLVSVSHDKTARFWDVATGRPITTLGDFAGMTLCAAFSPDGRQIATSYLQLGVGGDVRVWDLATNAYVRTLSLPTGRPWCVAYSPDGRYVGVTGLKHARIWDDAGKDFILLGHTDWVFDIAFSPDSSQVATASQDRSVRLWDLKTGRESMVLVGHTDTVSKVAYSPDGKHVVTASFDGTARVWDVASGREVMAYRGHYAAVDSAVYSPDGQQILTSSDDTTARVWDASTGRERLVLRGHTGAVERAIFSPDGQQIATASDDGTVRIWSTSSGGESSVLRTNAALWQAAFSASGEQIATAGEDGNIRIWDRQSGHPIQTLSSPAITTPAMGVAYNPDGQWIVAAYGNGDAYTWDIEHGTPITTFARYARVEQQSLERAIVSPDGRQVVVVGSNNAPVFYSVMTGHSTWFLLGHTNWVVAAAYSSDGQQIATCSADSTVRIWDASNGSTMRVLQGQKNDVARSVAFSPDGKQLASGWDGNIIQVWDVATGRELMTLRGHASGVKSVAYSPDGEYILSGSWDGTARLWDSATGREVMTLRGHTGGLTSAVFSPDGKYILTASDDGTARVYFTNVQDLVAAAQSRLTRELTTEECRKYLHVERCP